MPEQIELPDQPITYSDGRAQPWFGVLLRRISATVDGVLQFIDADEGVIVTADQVQQGIETKIEQILKKQVTETNAAGQITKVEYRDPSTDKLVKTRAIAYDGSGQILQKVDSDEQSIVTKDYTFDAGGTLDEVIADIQISGIQF